MSTEENKMTIKQLFTEMFHQGNLVAANDFIADDAIYHPFPPTFPGGPDGMRYVITMLRSSFPDQHIEVNDIIGEDDKVVVRSTFRGTQDGPLMGFPATGKQCTQSQISIFRLHNGKVIEYWFNADDLGMFRQLGFTLTANK